MNFFNYVRTCYRKQVVVAFKRRWMLLKRRAAEIIFPQTLLLNHCAHCAIEHDNFLFQHIQKPDGTRFCIFHFISVISSRSVDLALFLFFLKFYS